MGRSRGGPASRGNFRGCCDPCQPRIGWQKQAATCLKKQFLSRDVWPGLLEHERAMFLSQQGPMASVPLISFPTDSSRFYSQPFCILLLRRLQLPLSLSVRSCRCGRPLDALGHHRAACATAGVLGRRGWALESVAARVCREAGARVQTNVFVRDMDFANYENLDGRRLEVVADGFPLHGGAQLAIDTTMVSPLHSNGVARRGASDRKGLGERKEMTYPELTGEGGRARLVGRRTMVLRSCSVLVLLGLGQDSRPSRGVAGRRCTGMDQALAKTAELRCSEGFCSVTVGCGPQRIRWADFCARSHL